MESIEKLKKIKEHFEYLEAQLSSGSSDNFVKFSTEYAEVKPVAEAVIIYLKLLDEREQLDLMLLDLELKELATEEIKRIEAELDKWSETIRKALLPVDEADKRSVILEIRPGTGGDEAGLFAADLFSMYKKYSDNKYNK